MIITDTIQFRLNINKFSNYKILFLSEYSEYIKLISEGLLCEKNCIDLSDAFSKIEKELLPKVIEEIGNLLSEKSSIEFLTSSFFERNIAKTNNIFLRLVKIYLVKNYIDEDILIINNDRILSETIHSNWKGKCQLFLSNSNTDFFLKIKTFYKMRRRYLFQKIDKNKYSIDRKKKYTALISWVDNRNFDDNGFFRDTYFGRLINAINESCNLLFLPIVVNSNTRKNIISQIQEKFVCVPLISLSRYDILKSLIKSTLKYPLKKKYYFESIDISKIVNDMNENDYIENRSAFYYSLYYSIEKLKKNGVNILKLIYPFENQPWEKIVCKYFRKFYSDATVIGYMHTLPVKNFVSMFISENEKKYLPLPNYIFTTGKLSSHELKKYFDEKIIVENCALRYEYLFSKSKLIKRKKKKFVIGCFLSAVYEMKHIMFNKINAAFADDNNFKVYYKGHPTDNIFNEFLKIGIPANYEITDNSALWLIEESDIIIAAETTSSIEALKLHKPVLEIQPENLIQISRLDYCPELRFSARTSEEIKYKIMEILNWSENEKQNYFDKAEKFVEYCFNPVNDEYINEFINK